MTQLKRANRHLNYIRLWGFSRSFSCWGFKILGFYIVGFLWGASKQNKKAETEILPESGPKAPTKIFLMLKFISQKIMTCLKSPHQHTVLLETTVMNIQNNTANIELQSKPAIEVSECVAKFIIQLAGVTSGSSLKLRAKYFYAIVQQGELQYNLPGNPNSHCLMVVSNFWSHIFT